MLAQLQRLIVLFSAITTGQLTQSALPAAEDNPPAIWIQVTSKKPQQSNSPNAVTRFGISRNTYTRLQGVPTVRAIIPMRSVSGNVSVGAVERSLNVVGTTAEALDPLNLTMRQGRFLTDADLLQRASVCTISAKVSQQLFPQQNPVGRFIRLGQDFYRVVGITTVAPNPAAEKPIHVIIPSTTMFARMGTTVIERNAGSFMAMEYEFTEIWIRLQSPTDADATEKTLRSIMKQSSTQEDYEITRIPLTRIPRN